MTCQDIFFINKRALDDEIRVVHSQRSDSLSLSLSLSFIIDRVYIYDSVAFFNLFLEKYRASDSSHFFQRFFNFLVDVGVGVRVGLQLWDLEFFAGDHLEE